MRETLIRTAHRPPRPILSLSVGITGHRALSEENAALLRSRLDQLFGRITNKLAAIHDGHRDLFDDCAPAIALISPLADGADQLAAEVALAHRCNLRAALPFAREDYAADFDASGRARLDALLAQAEAVWTVPDNSPADPDRTRGYELAGETTVAHADLLVAAWDGKSARGIGGTAHVIDHAIRRGVPVVHLPTEQGDEPSILWAGFDDLQAPLFHREDVPRRPLVGQALEDMLDILLAPPPDACALKLFLAERERRLRTRPEWTLLLALTGVQPVRRATFRARAYDDAARADWAGYRAATSEACGPAAGIDVLERAFAWADGLALHYANVYRSGMVLNFAGAALAVLLSLSAWLFKDHKLEFLLIELAVIAAVILNTVRGTRREWHRRWLDYRFLAEQLRPLKSLKLIGAASPPFRARAGERRWTDWYALAVWRAMGPPPSVRDAGAFRSLARQVAQHELDGQVDYHAAAAKRMHILDHRLHLLGLILFVATIGIGFTALTGLLAKGPMYKQIAPLLSVLAAALPTAGGAIFGIRGAGDFAATAARSAETARRLGHAAALLRRDDLDYGTGARAVEEAAAIMLTDLGEWRTSYSYRKLAIPS